MGDELLNPGVEHVLQWVLLLSLAAYAFCVLSLVTMMYVGRWQNAVRQREENRRRTVLGNDVLDLKVRRLAPNQAVEAEMAELTTYADELEAQAADLKRQPKAVEGDLIAGAPPDPAVLRRPGGDQRAARRRLAIRDGTIRRREH
jgi:hypothetical protein